MSLPCLKLFYELSVALKIKSKFLTKGYHSRMGTTWPWKTLQPHTIDPLFTRTPELTLCSLSIVPFHMLEFLFSFSLLASHWSFTTQFICHLFQKAFFNHSAGRSPPVCFHHSLGFPGHRTHHLHASKMGIQKSVLPARLWPTGRPRLWQLAKVLRYLQQSDDVLKSLC